MGALKKPGTLCAIQAAAVPFALLAAYFIVKWNLWHTVAFPGERVSESPQLQERAMSLLWKFTPLYAALLWLAVGGMAYAFIHRADQICMVSGLNFVWLPFGPLTLIGMAWGLFVTGWGIPRRNWLPPLCSLIANVLGFLCFCWYFWENLVAFGD